MSIETKPTDCDGPPYPQWGQARSVDTSDVDWAGTAQYSGAGPGTGSGASTGTDAVAAAGANDDEEPWRLDGTPEPWGPDAGATTAEYAITTLAACGFAALLVVILKSEPIKELVTGVIQTALGLGA
ncbi:DUF4244 domain-containing protein [Brevibacterium sp. UCMA 11754]|uniref:DUF4244 domain-containing protein n=1 Tax=Brevibacterium sp. UCMA 11754 TaxID=2749198 RepID=UPI001F281CCD|nr:DUF4244 domain-containing protein [Brevibacterium sp. UCMA 11754]MCF2571628.1 DUF4244 domain-containing protein [Brevibacterium sp. UCMA 11754]